MGAFELIENYKIEKLYHYRGNFIYSFIKTEHLDYETHKQITQEKRKELTEILKDKRRERKKKHNTMLWQVTLHWLENYFDCWLKNNHPHLTGLEYSFIIKENNSTYLVIKNDLELELANKEQIGLIKKALGHDSGNYDKWIIKNAAKFRQILNESVIHKKDYIVFENLETLIEKEIND